MTTYATLQTETVTCIDKNGEVIDSKVYPLLVTSYYFKGQCVTSPHTYALDEFAYQHAISNLDSAEHWFKWGYQHGA